MFGAAGLRRVGLGVRGFRVLVFGGEPSAVVQEDLGLRFEG